MSDADSGSYSFCSSYSTMDSAASVDSMSPQATYLEDIDVYGVSLFSLHLSLFYSYSTPMVSA